MTVLRESGREAIRAFLAARQDHWTVRDSAALASAHTEDGVVHSPIFGVVTGRPEIEKTYRNLFRVFADWTFTGEEIIVDGPRVAQVFRVKATHTSELFGVAATNRRFEIHGALIFEFRNGLIARERRLYDFTSLLLQLGVLKAKPRG
jgi:ketosteroid isomerase-like protein